MRNKETLQHESFGLVRFSRCQGNQRFFGSQMSHSHYIDLEISNADVSTDLGSERFHSTKNLIRVRMTSVQFAELLTSMNYGEGIPCTVERVEGRMIEDLPKGSDSEKIATDEFREVNSNFLNNIKLMYAKSKDLIQKKSLSKDDKEKLDWFFGKTMQHIESNIPFYEEQFKTRVDRLVVEAKCEVESSILHKITSAGLEKLGIETAKKLN